MDNSKTTFWNVNFVFFALVISSSSVKRAGLVVFNHFTVFSYAFSAAICIPEFQCVWKFTVFMEILIFIVVTG